MIKTEIDEERAEEQDEDIVVEEASIPKPNYVYIIVAIILVAGALLATYFVTRTSVSQLPVDSSKYSNVSALPLGASAKPAVSPTQSTQSNYSQSPAVSSSLGAAYTGLQNTPQSKGTPTTSPLQSAGQSSSTGQSINSNLPY